MDFPSETDFLAEFGMEPVEQDPSMAYCRYVASSPSDGLEIEISFSAVTESFQIDLRCGDRTVATVCSERATSIAIWREGSGSGVKAIFDIDGVASQAWVQFEPELNLRWSTLRI